MGKSDRRAICGFHYRGVFGSSSNVDRQAEAKISHSLWAFFMRRRSFNYFFREIPSDGLGFYTLAMKTVMGESKILGPVFPCLFNPVSKIQ